ncbi:hypothetical protein IJM86_08710 [bacterium]|nr:hypothetical protein [bacterium]
MDAYKNKKLEDIQKDVKKNFEDNKKLSIRDDQEIYSAGITVIKQYITAIQNDKSLR